MKALVLPTGVATPHAVAAAQALAPSVNVLETGESHSPESLAALLASLGGNYDFVCAASDSVGRATLPRAAALCGIAMVSDVTAIEAGLLVRPIHAGRAVALIPAEPPLFFTVRAAAFPAATVGRYDLLPAAPPATSAAAHLIRAAAPQTGGRDLGHARTVVGIGRGAATPAALPSVQALAEHLHAALAGSRPAVDAGAVPESALLGQSGRSVSPDLYLALGISGAWQHFAGVRDAKTIVAINSDAHAPIFEWADYAWVTDLETALPELLAALQQ